MADQSPADQTSLSSSMQSLSVDSQPPSSSSTQMSLEEKFKIIRSVREECIQEDELLNLLNHKPKPICYDGFEPSSRMHIAQVDIFQLSMDQRKVNVLAREYCDDIKRKNKPIILSHHMLPGLQQGQEKMSKSDPPSSIFMEDEEVVCL
uniref:tyrosine--tRNA ligase n=1 Tax=Gossypium raimondii TaxID=29730 RepID=A0A0D2SNQ2_GOSRA|nr:hypothetical protein B456_007G209000 [Gossypium raimondii]